jgi:hypothetical protein
MQWHHTAGDIYTLNSAARLGGAIDLEVKGSSSTLTFVSDGRSTFVNVDALNNNLTKMSWLLDFVLAVSSQGSGVRGQGSEVRGQGSGIRGQGSGVRGQGFGVRGQGSGVWGQGSGVWGQGSGG